MPRFCGVINCGNRESRDKKRFFRVPAALKFGNDVRQVLSSRRRSKWILALRRADLTKTKLKYLWICEDHFVSGKPAHLLDSDNPDWVPSQLMGYEIDESDEEMEQCVEMQKSKVNDDVLPDNSSDSFRFGRRLLNKDNSNSVFIHFLKRKPESEALAENEQIRRNEIAVDIVANETNYAVKKAHIGQKSVSKEVQTDLTMEDIIALQLRSGDLLFKYASLKEKLKSLKR